MYSTCAKLLCGKAFLGEPAAWDANHKPICAACYNEMVYAQGVKRGKPITDAEIREAIGILRRPIDPGFPPPTMG